MLTGTTEGCGACASQTPTPPPPTPTHTHTHALQYMSPEMHRRQVYSYSADMWALGCIGEWALTGRALCIYSVFWRRTPLLKSSYTRIPSLLPFPAHELCTLQPLFITESTKTEDDVKQLASSLTPATLLRPSAWCRLNKYLVSPPPQVLSGRVPPLPGRYSVALRSVVSALLRPDPAQRPTAAEVLAMVAVQVRLEAQRG